MHNKGAQKRAAADISDDVSGATATQQVHKRDGDIGSVDEATLHRSKRKMDEKAKLYAELKRGEYLVDSSDDEEKEDGSTSRSGWLSAARRAEGTSLVDFDRKWAASAASKDEDEDEVGDGGKSDHDDYSLVEYEDELGRTRQGTKAEAAEAQRQRHLSEATSKDESTVPAAARPARPTNVIYGSAIQSAAFNPDANTAAQMSHLAERRDKSPTPPPETHYDPEGEVRSRGTGFYAFSKDESQRKEEMEELSRARNETMEERSQTTEKKSAREKAKEERKKKIEEMRGKRRAEEFLSGLEGIGVTPSTPAQSER